MVSDTWNWKQLPRIINSVDLTLDSFAIFRITRANSTELGRCGHRGNSEDRKEVCRAVEAIQASVQAHQWKGTGAFLRCDGLGGTGAVLADLGALPFVTRCTVSGLLDLLVMQTRVHMLADQPFPLVRLLADGPAVLVGSTGPCSRLVVATHPIQFDHAGQWRRTRWADLRLVCDEPAAGGGDGL